MGHLRFVRVAFSPMIGGRTQRAKIPANLVGPQIRRLRVALGWSQARLALRLQLGGLDLGRETIAQIEAQTHCVKDRDLHHFSRALACAKNTHYNDSAINHAQPIESVF